MMHSGHYNALRQASVLGDILVAGVHSDAEILRNKGPTVMNNEERLELVKACKWVDEVAFDTPYAPSVELLDSLNCDYSVHGDDMPINPDGTGTYAEMKKAGRLKVIKRTEGISTTKLVGRLLALSKDHLNKPDVILPQSVMSDEERELPLTSARVKAISKRSAAGEQVPANVVAPLQASKFLPTSWRIASFSNAKEPTKDDKVVYIDGSWDLFHVGHVRALKVAKALGTYLYVGIHDDATVNKHKGQNFPVMNLHERVMNVLSCKYVNDVVIGSPWEITKDLIASLNVSVVAVGKISKTDDAKTVVETHDCYSVPRAAGILATIDSGTNLNTFGVIDRTLANRSTYMARQKKCNAKEANYDKDKQAKTNKSLAKVNNS